MKTLRFAFFFVITLALYIYLDNSFNNLPPLGKFFSPHEGFWQNGETEMINLEDELSLDGVKGKVKIEFDELLIPHITASNENDAYFAQGYVTAYHRLWQMDFYSRSVFGRMSEVLGSRAINYDKEQRRIGLKFITEKLHDNLMKDEKYASIMNAYTAGVNAYINSLSRKDYPIEFKLLNYEPEQWTTLKSCIDYALFSNTLSRGEADLENTNALNLFGKELFDVLFPDQLGNLSPVIPAGTKWNFDPIKVEKPEVDFPKSSAKNIITKQNPLNGSNNFAVDGKKSKSGNPILANEPDLNLTLPSIWYATHLTAPGLNVMGVTKAGSPGIIIGFNDSIAWGLTNSPRDQVDWYSVQFRDDTRKEYLYNNKWFKTEQRLETIGVNGEDDVIDTIVYVHHGPVVYDRSFMGNGEKINYAMRWIAHDNATTFNALYKINHANNYAEFVEGLKYYSGPPQNIVFASVNNNIALELPGKFPVKWEEQGKYLMDGSKSEFEWNDYIPFEHRLTKLNSESGFLSSANQHPVDSLYPYYVYANRFEYYRNRRINDRLTVMSQVTPKDLMKLQQDNFNFIAFESLPMMLDSLDTSNFNSQKWEYYQTLNDWDFFNDPELKAPSIFELWMDLTYHAIWDEFDTIEVAIDKPNTYVTIHLMKTNPTFSFFDNLSTSQIENVYDIIQNSFVMTVDSLENWKKVNGNDLQWFKYKNTEINHILGLAPFSEKLIRIGGNRSIVNAASKYHGPSWRMVVELDKNGVIGYGVYPGSQTGNPGNPGYAKMIEPWASGEYFKLKFGGNKLTKEDIVHTLSINPKSK